jgi:hypothetical protein
MPLDSLMALLEQTTGQLSKQYEEVALDTGAYHRQFWYTWQQLPDGMTIAAMNRECEMACRALKEVEIVSTAVLEGYVAKRDALVAILHARSK